MKTMPPPTWDYRLIKTLRRVLLSGRIQPQSFHNLAECWPSVKLTSAINDLSHDFHLPVSGPNSLNHTLLRLGLISPRDRLQAERQPGQPNRFVLLRIPLAALRRWLEQHQPDHAECPVQPEAVRKEAVQRLSLYLRTRNYTPAETQLAYQSVFKESITA